MPYDLNSILDEIAEIRKLFENGDDAGACDYERMVLADFVYFVANFFTAISDDEKIKINDEAREIIKEFGKMATAIKKVNDWKFKRKIISVE